MRAPATALLALAFSLGAAQAAPLAFVTAQGANALAIVDLQSFQKIASLGVGAKPAGVAASADGETIFVSNPDDKSVSIIRRQPDGVFAREGDVKLGEGPLGLALDPRGAKLFVADWYSDQLYVIDTAQKTVVAQIKVGRSPSGMAVSPDGATLFVANRESDMVSVVDLAQSREIAQIPVGRAPFGVTFDPHGPDGPRVLVANVKSSDVSVIDPVQRREIRRLSVKSFPYVAAASENGGKILVTNQHDDSISVFDGQTYAPLGEIVSCGFPEGLGFWGTKAYVACWMDDVLAEIDLNSLTIDRKIAVGAGPRAFGAFIAPNAR